MKRILSLTLVAVMLLSTLVLTSCDAITDFFGGLFGGETKEEPARTTITEMEWRNAYKNNNYTLDFEQGGMRAILIVDDTVMKMEFVDYEIDGVNLAGMAIYFDYKNELLLSKNSHGYIAIGISEADFELPFESEQLHLGALKFLPQVDFSEITYEEQTKSYIAKADGTLADCYFENGKLVSVTLESTDTTEDITASIKNIGSSDIEIPEYINFNELSAQASTADKNVRTTITSSEWVANQTLNNYTLSFISSDMSPTIEVVCKQNDKAIEIGMFGFGKEIMKMQRVIIDGNLYELTESNGKTVAVEIGNQSTSLVNSLLGQLDFSSLKYNEAGRYYEYRVSDTGIYLYFENGNLVKFFVIGPSAKGIYFVDNIGSTVIDLPEYTVQK